MFLSVSEIAKIWELSERSVRNYCAQGRIEGAFLTGKTWNIPKDATKPDRAPNRGTLLSVLAVEKEGKILNGIYHKIQVLFAYNFGAFEGLKTSKEQTDFLFQKGTLEDTNFVPFLDIIKTINFFKCINFVIDNARKPLSEKFFKDLLFLIKDGTASFCVPFGPIDAESKQELGKPIKQAKKGVKTNKNSQAMSEELKMLLEAYNYENKTFETIIKFNRDLQVICPFGAESDLLGRIVMLKECLSNNIVPFVVDEELKDNYIQGFKLWNKDKSFLIDTCQACQAKFKKVLDEFGVKYQN